MVESSVNSSESLPVHDIPTFKLVLLGDEGTGKTTFVKSHFFGEFEKKYVATLGVEITPLIFDTNRGPVKFHVWGTTGQEKSGQLRDEYYVKGDCAIILFDVTCQASYNNVVNWYRDLVRVCGENFPVVLCGNKVDSTVCKINIKDFGLPGQPKLEYCEISARTKHNIQEPFLLLTRQLFGDDKLEFGTIGGYVPKRNKLHPAFLKQIDKELEEVQAINLPDDEDDNF